MRVLYVQYTNPGAYPPLVRGAELLVEAGAEVLMLGIHVQGTEALEVRAGRGLTVRSLPAAADGWRLKAHYARYAAWAIREAVAWKPRWIYASDLLSAPIALTLGGVTGARLVYHEHDAPSIAHPSWAINRCLAARQRLARQADIVIAPNATRAETLSRSVASGREVLTVWNCPRRPAQAAPRPAGEGTLRALFRGSINSDRLPLTVLDAIARLDDVTLDIAGYETLGSRGYVSHFLETARALGITDRVRARGTVHEQELAALCQQSDVGLALMPVNPADENMRHMAGASNKVFEYLSFGMVPVVTDAPDWRAAFVTPGYALACDPRDTESIAQALAWAQRHRTDLRTMAERGWQRLRADWNYETQFAPVLRAMLGQRERATLGSEPAEAQCAS